jgi:predicted transcriptional regulator
MDINSEKALLIREIEQLNDISLVRILKSMLHYALKQEGRLSLEQYNRELEEADEEIESGDFLSHEDALKAIRSWKEQ